MTLNECHRYQQPILLMKKSNPRKLCPRAPQLVEQWVKTPGLSFCVLMCTWLAMQSKGSLRWYFIGYKKQEKNWGWKKWKYWFLTLKKPKRLTERGEQAAKGIQVSLWSRSWKGTVQHVVRIGEKFSPELQLFQLCLLGVIFTPVLWDILQVGI